MTAGLVTETQPAQAPATRRSPWIISPLWDIALLVGSPLAIVPVLLWLGDHWSSPETISIAVLAFASAGHHLPGFLRAYGERDLFRRFRWRFLLAPPLAIAVSLWFGLRDLHGLSLVMLFWATWHGLMQTYGFMRIYDLKRGTRDALTARLDWALCLAIFAGGVLFSDARVANLAEAFWLSGGAPIDPSSVRAVRIAGGVVLAAVVLAYLANVARQGRSIAGVSGAKLALAASTGWLYWLGGALSTNVLIGVAMFEVFHALQYFAIVWVYNCRLASRLGERGGWARLLFQNRAAFLAIYAGVIAAWGLPYFLGGEMLSERTLAILMAVYTASAMLHFYYDGFIWKVRESDVQANLGVEPQRGAAPMIRPGVTLHLAKCLSLVGVLGVLAYGELRESTTRADERTMVARLQKLAGNLPEVQLRASRLAMERGDARSALSAAEAAAAARQRSHEAQYQLGWALLASGKPKKAIPALEAATQLAPGEWRNHYRLAMARMMLGDLTAAETALLEAQRLAPSTPEPERAMGDLRMRQNDVGQALVHYRAAIQRGDESVEIHTSLAIAEELDDNLAAAAQAMENAIDIDPNSPGNELRMGEIRRRQGEFDSAAQHFTNAVRLSPQSYAAWNNLGAMRFELGDAPAAAKAWRQAIEIDPRNAAAHYNLGLALQAQAEQEQADESFAKAESLGYSLDVAP